MSIGVIGGVDIVIDPNCFKEVQTEVKRTWKERLFSLPWNPFKKQKTVVHYKPVAYADMHKRVIYCHPDIADEIMKQLERKG